MSEPEKVVRQWKPISTKVPKREDFGFGLDEEDAWKEFGGKSLDAAYEHFLEVPECRQEDFMFMGHSAFLYYFPVIERFLYTVRAENEWQGCQAWILAQGIIQQLSEPALTGNAELLKRVGQLTDYVLVHLDQYTTTDEERTRIAGGWNELRVILDLGNSLNR